MGQPNQETEGHQVADTKTKENEFVAGSDEWWRVCAPYVTVKTSTTEGMRIIGLHTGGVLPLDVAQEQITHLASHGLIEKFPMSKQGRAQLAADPPGGEPGPQRVNPNAAAEEAKAEGKEEGGERPTPPAHTASTSTHRGGGTSRSGAGSK